jgi:hypothetical protein
MKKVLSLLFSLAVLSCYAQPTYILQPGYRDFFNKIKIDSVCISCHSGDFPSYVFQVNGSPIALAFEEDNDMIWNNLFYKPPVAYSGTSNLYLRLNPVTSQLTWNKLKKVDFDDIDASEVMFGAWDGSGGAETADQLKFTTDLALEFYDSYTYMHNQLGSNKLYIGTDNDGYYGLYTTYPAALEDFSYLLKDWTSVVSINHGMWVDKTTHNVTISNIFPSNFEYAFNVYDGFGIDETGMIRNYAGTGIEDGDILMGQASDNSYRPLELLGSGGVSISYTEGVGLTIDGSGAGGGGSVTSVGLTVTNLSGIGATTSVTGSPITGSGSFTLNIPDAGISVARGLVTNGTQTFEGDKTFNNYANFNDDATFVGLVWLGTNKTKFDGNGRMYLYNNVTPAAGMILKGDGTDFKTLALGTANQVFAVNAGATDADWTTLSTSNISEGSNQYYTDEKAQDAVGSIVSSPLVYSDGTPSLTFDITGLSSETSIDVDDDKLLMYDNSEGANNKITIEELLNEYAASYRKHSFNYYNEFINGVGTATGGNDIVSVSSGTGAASTGTTSTNATNTVGLVTSTTGTTATGRTSLSTYTSAIAIGGGPTVYEYRINGINSLSDGTNRYALVVGFFDTQSAANQVDGIYFLYDEGGVSTGSAASANWQTVTVSNSNRTFNTTSTAVVTTGTTLRIEVDASGTNVDYYIDGVITATSHTTNIPTGTARAVGFGMLLIKSIGTTARILHTDYMSVNILYTTPKN